MENNKKILVPTIVAVATLVLLVFGATYAYFTVNSTNNFGTKELSATVEDMASSVVLEQIENELSLDVTRAMMSEDNAGTTYYASGSSTPANIAKISVAGEGRYACDYTLSVTKSASSPEKDLYTAFQGMSTKSWNQLSLKINNGHYDFYTSTLFPITYSGTKGGITKDTPQYITANLALLNTNENQNALKGKDITLTFEVIEFDCYLTEADESAPIYAIVAGDNCEEEYGECTVAFYQNHDEVNVGDTYDGYKVTEIYTNLNNTNYTSREDISWPKNNGVNDVWLVIEEPIKPKNTAWWFNMAYVDKIYNLDTSEVTNMSHMFEEFRDEVDISSFDTSNVEDMSYMFKQAGDLGWIYGIETLNTSKVTNMQDMFASTAMDSDFIVDLSTWDTSKVTDMSSMFENAGSHGEFNVGNITRREVTTNGKTYIAWDTSKVTDMSYMFADAGIDSDYNLDLRSWQVPLVKMYEDFNLDVENKITPPNWVN